LTVRHIFKSTLLWLIAFFAVVTVSISIWVVYSFNITPWR